MHGGAAVDGSCYTRHVYETIVEATGEQRACAHAAVVS